MTTRATHGATESVHLVQAKGVKVARVVIKAAVHGATESVHIVQELAEGRFLLL